MKVVLSLLARIASGALSLTPYKVLLTVVSFYTTSYGLIRFYDVLGGHDDGGGMGWLTIIIPLSISSALHALIFWALHRWVSLRRRSYLLLGALPLQIIAVLTSFGYHWTHMRGPAVATEQYSASLSTTIRGVRGFGSSYTSMAGAMRELAAHSQQQAQIEERSGTSCGTQAGAGQGSRYHLRINDRAAFSALDSEIRTRVAGLEAVVKRAEALEAPTATQAIQNLVKLQRIVDEAQVYKDDPLLGRLKAAAEERRQKGRGPMRSMAGERAPSFSCPDPKLDTLLQGVVDSVNGLKPIPDVKVKDPRDPRVGFVEALKRLSSSILGVHFTPRTRGERADERRRELIAGPLPSGEAEAEDLAPLAVAAVIEILLTVLFWCGGGKLHGHPAVDDIRELAKRRLPDRPAFEAVWKAVGGRGDWAHLRHLMTQNANYEGSNVLLFVPAYSDHDDDVALRDFMRVLSHVGLARASYTGSWLAGLFALGMPLSRWDRIRQHGGVHVFKLSDIDYMALLLVSA